MYSSSSYANMRFTEMVIAQNFNEADKVEISNKYRDQFDADDGFVRMYLARHKALEMLRQSREALVAAKADTIWMNKAVQALSAEAKNPMEVTALERAKISLNNALEDERNAGEIATLNESLVVAANATFIAAIISRESGMHGDTQMLLETADYVLSRTHPKPHIALKIPQNF
jgi:hypothetical protein